MTIIAGFDIETTGLDQAEGHKIIEVALKLYDLDTREAKGSFIQRINPERSIAIEAQRVHGISIDELTHEPTWDIVGPKLAKIMNHCDYTVAHNGVGFDMPFLTGELLRIGAPLPKTRCIDTMLQASWATPNGKKPNLGELCYALEVDYDPEKAHSALYDVEVMMESFFKGYDLGFFKLD